MYSEEFEIDLASLEKESTNKGKKMKYSEKLLTEVLGKSVRKCIGIHKDNKNAFCYTLEGAIYSYSGYEIINKHELIHLLKEWAFTKGVIIKTQRDIFHQTIYASTVLEDGIEIHSDHRKSEFEAVYRSCDWILKNYKKEESMIYLIKVSGLWQKTTKESFESSSLLKAEIEVELFDDDSGLSGVLGENVSSEDMEEMGYLLS